MSVRPLRNSPAVQMLISFLFKKLWFLTGKNVITHHSLILLKGPVLHPFVTSSCPQNKSITQPSLGCVSTQPLFTGCFSLCSFRMSCSWPHPITSLPSRGGVNKNNENDRVLRVQDSDFCGSRSCPDITMTCKATQLTERLSAFSTVKERKQETNYWCQCILLIYINRKSWL